MPTGIVKLHGGAQDTCWRYLVTWKRTAVGSAQASLATCDVQTSAAEDAAGRVMGGDSECSALTIPGDAHNSMGLGATIGYHDALVSAELSMSPLQYIMAPCNMFTACIWLITRCDRNAKGGTLREDSVVQNRTGREIRRGLTPRVRPLMAGRCASARCASSGLSWKSAMRQSALLTQPERLGSLPNQRRRLIGQPLAWPRECRRSWCRALSAPQRRLLQVCTHSLLYIRWAI